MRVFTKKEVKEYSPTALAFYGDCVWEGLVRRTLLEKGNAPSGRLHSNSVEMVRASFQSEAVDIIEKMFSEEEADIFRRGRNATDISVPKSSNSREYHRATGLEALFGYLFLIGEYNRANELFEVVWNEKQKANQAKSD